MAVPRILPLVSAALLVMPALARAESLAQTADKQKEARSGKTTKVITDDDLRKAGRAGGGTANVNGTGDPATTGAPSASPTPEAGPQATPPGSPQPEKKEKTEDELRADRQKDWRSRRDKANQEVQRLSSEVDRLQGYANGLNAHSLADPDYVSLQLQQATDKVLGHTGAKVLLGSVLLN